MLLFLRGQLTVQAFPKLPLDEIIKHAKHALGVGVKIAKKNGRNLGRFIEDFKKEKCRMLATGGGAFNKYLIARIKYYLSNKNIDLIIPERNITSFKEAILMAFMGVLRMENIPNCMGSVTGARKDAIGGAIYAPTQ